VGSEFALIPPAVMGQHPWSTAVMGTDGSKAKNILINASQPAVTLLSAWHFVMLLLLLCP